METQTIGKFITALRKAAGMTQKELAEKLNISDKTVSRWEREESAPDLTLIPVIAEIFGVTCDELLRGQRNRQPSAEEDRPSPKAEKQRQRLLNASLTRYRNGCYISLGICAGGLIAAMICNLGFLRAYLGFFAACILLAVSAVCQAIFLNGAFSAVSEETEEPDIIRFRMAVVRLAKTVFGITLLIFGFTLPLILLPGDAYQGVFGDSWLLYGLLCAAGMLVLWSICCHFLNGHLLDKGILRLDAAKEQAYFRNRQLKRKCALLLVAVLLATGFLQLVANSIWNPWDIAKGTSFDNYGDFIAYMEQSVPVHYNDGTVAQPVPSDSVWYDEDGNEISAEEALREELYVYDGTPEGKLVCTYIHRNFDVVSIRPADTEDGLPVTVITNGQMLAANAKNRTMNLLFIPLYLLEAGMILAHYRKKRLCM